MSEDKLYRITKTISVDIVLPAKSEEHAEELAWDWDEFRGLLYERDDWGGKIRERFCTYVNYDVYDIEVEEMK